MRSLDYFEAAMTSMQQDAHFMSVWLLVFLAVFLLSMGGCALMWALSSHRDNPNLRYSEPIEKAMAGFWVIGVFVLVAIIIAVPFLEKGRMALRFLSIWFPMVGILGILALSWTQYQQKGK